MSQVSFPIDLQTHSGANGVPRLKADFGRITVLLGSNGTGKSKALQQIRNMAGSFGVESRPIVSIEGGRVIAVPSTLDLTDYNNFQLYREYDLAEQTFKNRRLSPQSDRGKDVFFMLERKSQAVKRQHSDAVAAWQAAGSVGPCPEREPEPLGLLFSMFHEVFPEITLSLSADVSKQLFAHKDGTSYSVTQLSDGERQVLFILADIAITAEPLSLVTADEPELNLNSHLASRLWDTIERRLPEAIFVYATHNVSFAMRPSVDVVVALSGRKGDSLTLTSVAQLPDYEARELLGAIPAIIAASAAIGVEGVESSFDKDFYSWVLGRTDVAVVPLEGCQDVKAATTRTGIWTALAPSVRLTGVVDRDYRSDQTLAGLSPCLVLPFHEAESYLCHPDVVVRVATGIGTLKTPTTHDLVIDRIAQFFESQKYDIAVRRVADRATFRLGVSLEKSAIKSASVSLDSLREAVAKAAAEEAEKVKGHVGPDAVVAMLEEEVNACEQAIASRDAERMLRFVPGKELLPLIAHLAACRDADAYLRGCMKHVKPEEVAALKELRRTLSAEIPARGLTTG